MGESRLWYFLLYVAEFVCCDRQYCTDDPAESLYWHSVLAVRNRPGLCDKLLSEDRKANPEAYVSR